MLFVCTVVVYMLFSCFVVYLLLFYVPILSIVALIRAIIMYYCFDMCTFLSHVMLFTCFVVLFTLFDLSFFVFSE